jgi:hypothetical protein
MIILNWTDVGVFQRPAEHPDEPWPVAAAWLVAWETLPNAAKYLRLRRRDNGCQCRDLLSAVRMESLARVFQTTG